LDREGGRHTIYANPATGPKATVTHHAEVRKSLRVEDLSTACDQADSLTAGPNQQIFICAL
jgi:hypothetical protein